MESSPHKTTVTSMKLYLAPASQPSRAVAWFIEIHGLKEHFEVVMVDLMKGDASLPDFKAKCIYESVPVLELMDGTTTICDSGAILIYLAKKFGIKGEMPEDLVDEAKMYEALLRHDSIARRITTDMLRKVMIRAKNPKTTWNEVKHEVAKNEADLVWTFTVLDQLLGRGGYICGTEWTLVDYLVAAEVSQWPEMSSMLPESLYITRFPNIVRYNELISHRPGFAGFIAPFKFLVTRFGLDPVGGSSSPR
jgi:glutathione S-transferase